MRPYVILIFLAVALAFSAGALSLSIRNAPKSADGSVGDITQLKTKFQREHTPEIELALPSLFESPEYQQLIEPGYTVIQNNRFSFREISALYRYSKSCAPETATGPEPGAGAEAILAKSWIWARFCCGEISRLPPGFFETAPFVSALGGSFAFLALQRKGSTASPEWIQKWIQDHVRFFHAAELAKLGNFPLDHPRRVLAALDMDSLKALSDGDELVLGTKHVLFRQPVKGPGTSESTSLIGRASTYRAFLRSEWETALARSDFRASGFRDGQLCILKDGHVCWRIATDELFRSVQLKTLLLFLSSLLMTGLCIQIVIRRFQSQRKEEERKRFALQTLTHELRTPLSSLVLGSEEVLDHFDRLPPGLQGTLLRMCDDIQRLHRLTEVSKQYLGSETGELVRFEFKPVPSIRTYLDSVLEPYDGKLEVQLPPVDAPTCLDPYWVGICIRNLVDNALMHGRPPVIFSAGLEKGALVLCVQDAGSGASLSLDRMSQAFEKGANSRGLGLGLAIVKQVACAMGADLAFSTDPTRFTLRIRQPESQKVT